MSVSVKTYDFSMPPYGACQIQAGGTYFRVQSSSGPIKVQGEFGEATPLLQGQGLKDSEFSRLSLTNLSGNQNTGTIIIAGDEFVDQQMVLSGGVSNNSFDNINKFTWAHNISSTSFFMPPAPYKRRYLFIQNQSDVANFWLGFESNNALGSGILIPPGGVYEPVQCPSAAIYGISDVASGNMYFLQGW